MSALEVSKPKSDETALRDASGRFKPGGPGGPGRPPGSGKMRLDAAKVLTERHGPKAFQAQLVEILDALRYEVSLGGRDMVKAAELWLTHCAEVPEKGPLVALNLNAPTGPPVPRLPDLAANLAGMLKIANDRGIVEGGPEVTVLIEDPDEVEEFLS